MIVDRVLGRARAVAGTSVVQVKSQIGIWGSDEVDQLATSALDPQKCTDTYHIGKLGLEKAYWPCYTVTR